MTAQERLYTAAELLALPRDGPRYDLVRGTLIEMSPSHETHGLLTNEIAFLVTAYARDHKLGHVYGAETGFKLAENPDTVYGVDVAFVSKARLKRATEDFFAGAPDLAVEVVSPGNTRIEIHEKVKDYFGAGTRLVWVVYPKSRAIYVYRSESEVTILKADQTLEGGEVLPGFSIHIADIFAVLDNS